MTRIQVKNEILSLLVKEGISAGRPYSPYELGRILEPTAEKIMKFWNQNDQSGEKS